MRWLERGLRDSVCEKLEQSRTVRTFFACAAATSFAARSRNNSFCSAAMRLSRVATISSRSMRTLAHRVLEAHSASRSLPSTAISWFIE